MESVNPGRSLSRFDNGYTKALENDHTIAKPYANCYGHDGDPNSKWRIRLLKSATLIRPAADRRDMGVFS